MSRCGPNNGCLFRCVRWGRGRGGICRAPLSFTRRWPPQLMHQNRDNDRTEHPAGFPLALSAPPTRDSRPLCLLLIISPPPTLILLPLSKGSSVLDGPPGARLTGAAFFRSAALRIRGAFVCVIWVEIQPLNYLRNKRKKTSIIHKRAGWDNARVVTCVGSHGFGQAKSF